MNKGKRPANAPVDYKVRLTVNHVDSKDDTEPRIPRQYECTLKSDSETSKYAFVEDGRGGGL